MTSEYRNLWREIVRYGEIEISESDLQECLEYYGLPINEF